MGPRLMTLSMGWCPEVGMWTVFNQMGTLSEKRAITKTVSRKGFVSVAEESCV